ncbi:long-chain acyl-CoA synthetase [Bacillus thermophilus]|uniref:Long-chain acyl-CoA synthetase n=1 Tax=Siminovitchia thermophila TaxID=1245522 RepID=A0ABS2R3I6_9BACI|nr:long-chain fatty acid--CoA ligase [Siminovitchia thermophila]MBM7714182.1 long-chain acyl-CoA synthetase [Siminovitchia thermophila]ONK23402.1 long-chain fatty acid--CoA ligase [Bacillus sp. VT-16-64]
MKVANVLQMLNRTVEQYPNHIAYQWKEEGSIQKLTYQNLWNRIKGFANGLTYIGIKPEAKVAIISNSNPMWAISDFALASISAVSVPIYPTIPAEQVAYIIKNCDITAAIVENKEQYDKLISTGVQLDHMIMMFPQQMEDDGFMTFKEVENIGDNQAKPNWEQSWQHIPRDQLLTIMNTSGTTGKPKGVMLTHGNILANIEGVQFWVVELLPEDVSLSYLPLSHIFERLAGHYLPLSIGTTISYAENITTIPENLQEFKPTVMTSVPRLFEKVYTKIQSEMENGSAMKRKIFNWALSVGEEKYKYYLNATINQYISQDYLPKKLARKWKIANKLVYQKVKNQLGGRLRGLVSGGGTLNADIARFFWALDIPLLEGYGLTETSPIISTNPFIRAKVGTVGKILPNVELKMAPDGEILVKGPNITQGYYNNPQETEKAFEDGWFKTGDIGKLDEDGYLKVIDRKKRILVLSTGMNVAPAPVETAINESAYISQSLVVGDNRKYIIALVNPDYENVIPWAKAQGIRTDSKEALCKDKKVQQLLNKEVATLTKKFTNYAQPKKVIIISEEWTIDGGELTPKLSLKADIIENRYQDLIDSVYKEESVDHQVAVTV